MRKVLPVTGIGAIAVLAAWWLTAPDAGPKMAAVVRSTPRGEPAPAPIVARSPTPRRASEPRSTPAPDGPAPASDPLRELDERFDAWVEQAIAVDLPEGATREEEDRLMLERFKEITGEAARLEKAYEDVITSSDRGRVAAIAAIAIGDLKDELAADILEAHVPTYLTVEQAELYRTGLEDKAHAAREAAHEAWERAASYAEGLPDDAEIEALLAERRAAPEEAYGVR